MKNILNVLSTFVFLVSLLTSKTDMNEINIHVCECRDAKLERVNLTSQNTCSAFSDFKSQ